MPQRLTTTINKILRLPNSINSSIIQEFHRYMQSSGCSEKNQNNNLKAIIAFANFIGADVSFYDIHNKEQILCYLDTKIKNIGQDPEEKWITTWNDYLNRIKLFFGIPKKSSRAVEALLRQGRKYGLGGCIATQRIAYLNTNALQQLHTYFVGTLPRPYDRNPA
jgi:hypothetical protein